MCINKIYPTPKPILHLTVVGGKQPSWGMPGGAMPSVVMAIGQGTS